jgi:hypothetical protein
MFPGAIKTPEGLLRDYQRFYDQLSDVPEPLRSALVQGAIRQRYGGRMTAEVLGIRIHPCFADRAWRVAQALQFLRLDEHWPQVAKDAHLLGPSHALVNLGHRVTDQQREDLRRLLCRTRWPMYQWDIYQKASWHGWWTKGGTWMGGPWTTLIVCKGHLERRRVRPQQYRYSDEALRAAECAIHQEVDPDQLFPFLCRQKAVRLVRQMLKMPLIDLAWFFQSDVPNFDARAKGLKTQAYADYIQSKGILIYQSNRRVWPLRPRWSGHEWYDRPRRLAKRSDKSSASPSSASEPPPRG